VGVGKKDGATVNDLVAVLTKELRVDRGKIGRVELRDAFCLVELPAQDAERVASALNGTTIRRRRVTARVDRGTPTRSPAARPSTPRRTSRPPETR
jgi:ATP-dependent RNA helicase DeaD